MRFHQSLSTGKQSEEMVLNRIKHKYPNAYIEDGYFNEECSNCGFNEINLATDKVCLNLDFIDCETKNCKFDNLR